MPAGIKPRALGLLDNNRVGGSDAEFGIPFEIRFQTVVGQTAYNWVNDSRRDLLVTRAYGYMTGAGAGGDSVVLQRVRAGSVTAITDTADLSVFSDTDQFDFSQINDANNRINQTDTLRLTAASDALCNVYIQGFWVA
jgi:hypothetical protein